jgi:magnesium-transporting ATPase (P-type)
MSVIIRDENNVIKLICKGADTVIKERLDMTKR